MPADEMHEPPKQRSIVTLPFDQRAILEIGKLLDQPVTAAPFQLPGGEVHQIVVGTEGGTPRVMVTLWPSIRRVDAIGTGSTVVFTNVQSVDLVEGVEVLFRRSSREYLIVTCAGKVIVRA
jgi:hypothetical protein